MVNVGHPEGHDELEKVLTATMRKAFPQVIRDPMKDTSTLLVAGQGPLSAGRLRAAAARLPIPLREPARQAARRIEDGLTGGTVYTDDRAPVEWLIDKSIVKYAAGK